MELKELDKLAYKRLKHLSIDIQAGLKTATDTAIDTEL